MICSQTWPEAVQSTSLMGQKFPPCYCRTCIANLCPKVSFEAVLISLRTNFLLRHMEFSTGEGFFQRFPIAIFQINERSNTLSESGSDGLKNRRNQNIPAEARQ